MNDTKLKSCPFCGGEAMLLNGRPGQLPADTVQAYVQCRKCKAKSKTFTSNAFSVHKNAEKLAVEAWQTRTGEGK